MPFQLGPGYNETQVKTLGEAIPLATAIQEKLANAPVSDLARQYKLMELQNQIQNAPQNFALKQEMAKLGPLGLLAQIAQKNNTQRHQMELEKQAAEANRIRALGARNRGVPAGYRMKPDGTMEAIPGGPADTKLQGQLNQDTSMMNETQSNLDRLAAAANDVKEHPGLSKITGLMSVAPLVGGLATIPGTEAANAAAKLQTLKSQVGFGVLQQMRNNSKTGGALGQVSDFENKLLQQNLAALDTAQSYDEYKKALDQIIKYTEGAKTRLRAAYNMKHQAAAGNPQPTAPIAPRVVDW